MRKFIYLILICLGCGLVFSNCSSKNKEKEEVNLDIEQHDPFKFDSVNFNDFMKQSWAGLSKDSNNYSFAVVEEELYDSLILDEMKNNKIIFGLWNRMINNKREQKLFVEYYDNGNKVYNSDNQRFLQVLEAMKQIRNKMNYKPKFFTDMYFDDNKNFEVYSSFNPKKEEWKPFWILIQVSKDTLEIPLTIEQFDTIISKMNRMRSYLMR